MPRLLTPLLLLLQLLLLPRSFAAAQQHQLHQHQQAASAFQPPPAPASAASSSRGGVCMASSSGGNGSGMSSSPPPLRVLPKAIIFDLDATLWTPELYEIAGRPFRRVEKSKSDKKAGGGGPSHTQHRIVDRSGYHIDLFPEARRGAHICGTTVFPVSAICLCLSTWLSVCQSVCLWVDRDVFPAV